MKYILVTSAYNKNMEYIGDEAEAKRLYDSGIEPELAHQDNNVCSIGFCEKEQKWYGWSHRAISGFGIGSKVAKGDCAYHAPDKEAFIESCRSFWEHETHTFTKAEDGTSDDGWNCVKVSWLYSDRVPNNDLRGKTVVEFMEYPKQYGKGEWTADTLEDAKRMAIDFADGVR